MFLLKRCASAFSLLDERSQIQRAGEGRGEHGYFEQLYPMSFGNDYYSSLQTLTFNSRPIIESHTALAQENVQYAQEIVSAIEKRIEKAIPNHKLFALYLLDSISKNIGLPYTSLFSKNLFKTFTTTYGLVDDPTRCKLIKLFKTWKLPTALTGMPLFDSNQLTKIEEFLIKVTANNYNNTNITNTNTNAAPNNLSLNPNTNSIANPIQNYSNVYQMDKSKNGLIKETNELLNLVESRLQSSHDDEKGHQRFTLLNQLKTILSSNSNIPQVQLDEVAKQLQSIKDDELLKLNIIKQQKEEAARKAATAASISQQSMPIPQLNASTLQNLLSLTNSKNQEQPLNQNGNALGFSNISFLQNILKKADSSSLSPPSSGSLPIQTNNNLTSNMLDFNFIRPTKNSILEDFQLDQSFINKHIPTSIEISLLYEFQPIQCSSCSKRFEDSEKGIRDKRIHEQWHLRVEKRLKMGGSGMGGVVNRSWYLELQEWIDFNDDLNEEVSNSLNKNSNGNNPSSRKDKKNRNDDDSRDYDPKDADKHLITIPESSNNEIICGICHDDLVGVYDEDSGDWVWKNATKDDSRNRVVHWTCWMETRDSRVRDHSPTR